MVAAAGISSGLTRPSTCASAVVDAAGKALDAVGAGGTVTAACSALGGAAGVVAPPQQTVPSTPTQAALEAIRAERRTVGDRTMRRSLAAARSSTSRKPTRGIAVDAGGS